MLARLEVNLAPPHRLPSSLLCLGSKHPQIPSHLHIHTPSLFFLFLSRSLTNLCDPVFWIRLLSLFASTCQKQAFQGNLLHHSFIPISKVNCYVLYNTWLIQSFVMIFSVGYLCLAINRRDNFSLWTVFGIHFKLWKLLVFQISNSVAAKEKVWCQPYSSILKWKDY